MQKMLILVTAAAIAGGGLVAAQATTGGGTTPVRCLDTVWQTSEVSTSSTTFSDVPGFADSPASVFPIVIDVSAVVSGAPVEFRVLSTNIGDQTVASKPGRTTFVPGGGGPDSFSFQWIEKNQSAAEHANELRLQWRSATGGDVHLLRGDMAVSYDTDACVGSL
jgi:D-serine deaminase-like pyridoxal phosphate-dependent protein